MQCPLLFLAVIIRSAIAIPYHAECAIVTAQNVKSSAVWNVFAFSSIGWILRSHIETYVLRSKIEVYPRIASWKLDASPVAFRLLCTFASLPFFVVLRDALDLLVMMRTPYVLVKPKLTVTNFAVLPTSSRDEQLAT